MINHRRVIVALMLAASPIAHTRAQNAPHAAEHHEFVIDNFRTESGVTLPKARIVYGTYGRLNAARDNVVLLPSHYMANHHGYEWLIGPDRALDPSKLFLVATELFGNGFSSSPSNTPEPFHGPRFPVMTIRDNVEAVRRLLAEDLKVTHVRAIIGFSMGAEQAFQWAVSHPGVRRSHRRDLGHREGLAARHRAPRRTDHRAHRRPGVQRRRLHGAAAQGHRSLRNGLARLALLAGVVAPRDVEDRRTPIARSSRRSRAGGGRSSQNNDANDLILQARTWQRHDVGTTPGLQRRRRSARCARSPCRCCTCRRKPTSISRSATRGSRRSSSRTSRSCRFRRSGDTRPARAAIPPIARFSTRTSAVSSRSVGTAFRPSRCTPKP